MSDPEVVGWLENQNDANLNDYILQELPNIVQHTIEMEAYNAVNNLIIPNNVNQYEDLIKTALYFSWHKCQIEDRTYPQSVGWDGRDMYITLLNESL